MSDSIAENEALIRALGDAVQFLSHDARRATLSDSPRTAAAVDAIHIEESLAALVARRAERVEKLAVTVQHAQRDFLQCRRESALQIGRLQLATGRADVAVLALKHKSNALNAIAQKSDTEPPLAAPLLAEILSAFDNPNSFDIDRSASALDRHTPRAWLSRPLSSRQDTRQHRPASSWRRRASSLNEALETHAQETTSEETRALDDAVREAELASRRSDLHSNAIMDELVAAAYDVVESPSDGAANSNLSPPRASCYRPERNSGTSSSASHSKILQPAILFSTLAQELGSLHLSPSTARIDFLNRAAGLACRVLGAEHATVYMHAFGANFSHIDAVASTCALAIRLPLGVGLAGTCALTGKSVNVADAQLDARFCADFDRSSGVQTRSVLCVPIFEHADSPSNSANELMPPVDRLLNRSLFRSRKRVAAAGEFTTGRSTSPVLVGVLQVLNKPSKFTSFDECAADLIALSISHFLASDNLCVLISKRQSDFAGILSVPLASSVPSAFAAAGTVFSQLAAEIKCSVGALSLQNKFVVPDNPQASVPSAGALEAFGLPLWSLASHLNRTLDVEIVNFFFLPRVLDSYLPSADSLNHIAVYAPHIESAAKLVNSAAQSTAATFADASLSFLQNDELVLRSPPFEIIACIMQPEQVVGIFKEMRIDIGSELLEACEDGDSAAFCPRGILGAALGRGMATATMSTPAHPLFRDSIDIIHGEPQSNSFTVPITNHRLGSMKIVGAIQVANRRRDIPWSPHDERILAAFACQLSLGLEHRCISVRNKTSSNAHGVTANALTRLQAADATVGLSSGPATTSRFPLGENGA